MSEEFDALVWRCLEDLERGVALESILSQHPQQVDELRPILQVAAGLPALAASPPARAQAAAQEQFLLHAAAMRQVSRPRAAWPRRLGLALTSLAVLLAALFGLVQGSAEAVPGDALYPVKRARENVQLALAADPTAVNVLRHEFNVERADEIKTLLTIGRDEEVECEADIEDLRDGVIEVYGLDLRLTDATTIKGALQVGRTIKVTGYTADGRLFATAIEVEAEDEDETHDDSAAPSLTPFVPLTVVAPDVTAAPGTVAPAATEVDDSADDDAHTPDVPTRADTGHEDDSDEVEDAQRATPSPENADDNSGSGDGGSADDKDNSGSGSDDSNDQDNSGSGDDDSNDDNSGSGNDDSDDDEDNSGPGSDDSDDDEDNSGSGGGDSNDEDNSGSSHDASGDDDNSGREGSDAGTTAKWLFPNLAQMAVCREILVTDL